MSLNVVGGPLDRKSGRDRQRREYDATYWSIASAMIVEGAKVVTRKGVGVMMLLTWCADGWDERTVIECDICGQ
jgi:hypothetical protein